MKFKHIHFIINPASGKKEPILNYINNTFADSAIDWDITLTKKNRSPADIAKGLIGKTDVVAVYGGDGCVTSAASALHGTKTPIGIIPGGTANVMAKELGIPIDSVDALKLLLAGNQQIKAVDMGLVNGTPFLLRVNLGIMADMVIQADRNLKEKIGQLAYGISTLKTLTTAEPIKYHLNIDKHQVDTSGVALTITNSGSMGIGEFELLPGISITDGLLDVILMKDNDLMSVMKIAGNALLQQQSEILQHWTCKEVTISMESSRSFICDDMEKKAKELIISVVPHSINFVVPC